MKFEDIKQAALNRGFILNSAPFWGFIEGAQYAQLKLEQEKADPMMTPCESLDAEDINALSGLLYTERELIDKALEKSHGNRKQAAARLGLSERTLYRKIKEYGL